MIFYDILEYDKVDYGMSSIAAMMHELYEQYQKSKRGLTQVDEKKLDISTKRRNYREDHGQAVVIQNKIDNTSRSETDFYDPNNPNVKFNMLYVDHTNNQVVAIGEIKQGDQYTPIKTIIKPDENGVYTLKKSGSAKVSQFKLENGKVIPMNN